MTRRELINTDQIALMIASRSRRVGVAATSALFFGFFDVEIGDFLQGSTTNCFNMAAQRFGSLSLATRRAARFGMLSTRLLTIEITFTIAAVVLALSSSSPLSCLAFDSSIPQSRSSALQDRGLRPSP